MKVCVCDVFDWFSVREFRCYWGGVFLGFKIHGVYISIYLFPPLVGLSRGDGRGGLLSYFYWLLVVLSNGRIEAYRSFKVLFLNVFICVFACLYLASWWLDMYRGKDNTHDQNADGFTGTAYLQHLLNGAPRPFLFIRHTLVNKYAQLGVKMWWNLFYRPKEIHHSVTWSFLNLWFFSLLLLLLHLLPLGWRIGVK